MTLWTIKIGTSLLRGNKEFSTNKIIETYCGFIAESKAKGDQVIIVSSGAVGLGCNRLGLKVRPNDLNSLQAAAAVGQGYLMSLYESAMKKYGYNVAQILLTRSDFESKRCFKNASLTIKKLLDWKVLPIINENDSIANEELRYGDNDTLSALVSTAISADQLVLLTDIDKLYSSDPKFDKDAKPITDVHSSNEIIQIQSNSNESNNWGTGGIKTKLTAAQIATKNGITVHLADGREPKILKDILKGSRGGTVFHPNPKPIGTMKSWLAHALYPQGTLHVDDGAYNAIQNKGASLLIVGIINIDGDFAKNQPVKIVNLEGIEIAKGISSISSESIRRFINNRIKSTQYPVVVHRDVLVLSSELLI
ncbi:MULTISPECIES: glutamate 5-kinase [Prochlorococcus]|uniref:Glutamate 5-kinase n=1 Tax=Prochlorococcus marinus (strain SARG / CCMP1375 / SS120) TaxID=167539 RepID=PROB_PROMA|nr:MULTISPECIES: glutamate 5-kinase [Prochlorococcus]Q7VC78.1 RecName: Full=Glutamate 5-kinase; AltName: Full=Gamma-glutamyl kinase; Short=GK [Prochlorococcus marinus subsp. marinus str. CCMP1375]AAP99908.1 Glutamate 5-kinase [Prochlorococcus marinus subsp. marinus str. CCMP1375]KGG11744.1 Glutamate 5-kinase [Prochlorococcus marinus str. LG]KGG18842.1 Glutamate 5-kinase [Prochlorococcus marinus str. SS2]KGG23620.1 Glutamate 5-kinase [Prochlorococcus marinus str. SS35]KGG32144.1 Glutamate 5-ki